MNTLIKRLRYSYNSLSQLKNKELNKYLRLHRSNVVCDSDSDQDEYDFQVDKSYFTSSDEDQMDNSAKTVKKTEEELKTSDFTKNVQLSIREGLIQGINISNHQKNKIIMETFKSNLATKLRARIAEKQKELDAKKKEEEAKLKHRIF